MYGSAFGSVDPDEDVSGEAQPEEDRAVGQRDVRQLARALDEDPREAGRDQQRGRDQRHELSVASAHRASCPSSAACTRLIASACERSWWLVICTAPRARHVLERDPRHVEGLVQADPERQVVGEATEDRHDPLVVGADEEQLPGREIAPAADQEQDDHDRQQRRERLPEPAEAAAAAARVRPSERRPLRAGEPRRRARMRGGRG